MKKNILLISLLLYTLIVSGQNKIDFDVHAGYGLSYLKGSNTGISANSDVKLGFTGGIGMALPLVKMWFIQPEINYQNIGGGQDKTAIIPLQNYKKFTLQYVSIPVLIKFKIPQSGPGLFAGSQYGYLFSKKLKTISDTFVGTV